jgi:hypothetical protein
MSVISIGLHAETDGLVVDKEDEEEESSDEEDYECKDYNYQNKHILPDQYHIEIEGVCAVTASERPLLRTTKMPLTGSSSIFAVSSCVRRAQATR